jgi:WD40 repeat protein
VEEIDLAWIDALLRKDGPVGVEVALADASGPVADAIRRAVACHAHLLDEVEPAHANTDVLLSYLSTVDELRPLVAAYRRTLPSLPRLTGRDLPAPHPALRRVIDTGSGINHVAVAPDGTWLAIADLTYGLVLYDVATGDERVQALGMTLRLDAIAISPDGASIAGTHDGGRLLVWHVPDAEPRLSVDLPENGGCLAFTPDGATLVVSSTSTVYLLDAATGAVRGTMTRPPETPTNPPGTPKSLRWTEQPPIERFTLAPDGTWLAVVYRMPPVELWDLSTGTVRPLEHSDADHVVIAPDGRWLMTTTRQRTRIWDLATGDVRAEFTTSGNAYLPPAASTGTRAVSVGSRGLRLWDLSTGEPGAVLPLLDDRRPFAIAPDGTWLAQTVPGGVQIWGIDTWLAHHDPDAPVERRVAALTATTGTWLVMQDADEYRYRPGSSVRLVDVTTGEVWHTFEASYRPVCAIAPDGSWFVVTDGSESTRLWDTATGTHRAVVPGRTYRVAVAPDGSWFATWAHEKVVHRWDAATGGSLGTVSNSGDNVHGVAIAPDGTWMAIGDSHGQVRLKNVATGRTLRVLRGAHRWYVSRIVIAPDGTWLATTDSTNVRVWHTATGANVATLGGHRSYAAGVSLSPDGAWLASVDARGLVRVWRTATWDLCAAMRVDCSEPRGCAWFADGTGVSVTTQDTVFLLEFTPGDAGR